MTNTPQPHPSTGECLSPPLGGDVKVIARCSHMRKCYASSRFDRHTTYFGQPPAGAGIISRERLPWPFRPLTLTVIIKYVFLNCQWHGDRDLPIIISFRCCCYCRCFSYSRCWRNCQAATLRRWDNIILLIAVSAQHFTEVLAVFGDGWNDLIGLQVWIQRTAAMISGRSFPGAKSIFFSTGFSDAARQSWFVNPGTALFQGR